jgi:hypothetical protein
MGSIGSRSLCSRGVSGSHLAIVCAVAVMVAGVAMIAGLTSSWYQG